MIGCCKVLGVRNPLFLQLSCRSGQDVPVNLQQAKVILCSETSSLYRNGKMLHLYRSEP